MTVLGISQCMVELLEGGFNARNKIVQHEKLYECSKPNNTRELDKEANGKYKGLELERSSQVMAAARRTTSI